MADTDQYRSEEERQHENMARAERGEPPLPERAAETSTELGIEEIGDALDTVTDRHDITGTLAPAPGDQSKPGDLADPEEQKKLIRYFDEERPWMREQMQADQAREQPGREEAAMRAGAERIEADRSNRTEYQPKDRTEERPRDDDRKPGREEYQPGSHKPAEKDPSIDKER